MKKVQIFRQTEERQTICCSIAKIWLKNE